MSEQFRYEADWRQYAYPPQKAGFASRQTLLDRYTQVSLDGQSLRAGGMPISCDGKEAIVNTGDDHTVIFGGTASKKTRTLIVPLINVLAQAKESMIIMDIKGELSDGVTHPSIRSSLEANGYDCRFLNFRDFNGDGYNLLLEPYRLYREGNIDEALSRINDMATALAAIYKDAKVNPLWELTAKQYLVAVIALLFETCSDPKKVNMLTVNGYTNESGCRGMTRVANLVDVDNNVMTMLRQVLSEPEGTKMSTLATVNSMIADFLINDKLLRMLSCETFNPHDIGKKPTALFLIMPDETDTHKGIIGLILQQLSSTLVRDAAQSGGKLPRRVNFVCDEFCNYYVPGMMRAISAHRSRNIRWYLVCQSKKQLKACYPKEADTILANCSNLFFLNSSEMELLEYLSDRAGGTTVTESGGKEPILKVSDLQSLKKGWTHTDVYFTHGNLHYVGSLPDIDGYPGFVSSRTQYPMPCNQFDQPEVYSAFTMALHLEKAIRLHKRGAFIGDIALMPLWKRVGHFFEPIPFFQCPDNE